MLLSEAVRLSRNETLTKIIGVERRGYYHSYVRFLPSPAHGTYIVTPAVTSHSNPTLKKNRIFWPIDLFCLQPLSLLYHPIRNEKKLGYTFCASLQVVAMEDAKAAADGILDSLRQLVLLGLTSCDHDCWPNHCLPVVNMEKEMKFNSLNGISDCLTCYALLQFIVYSIEVHRCIGIMISMIQHHSNMISDLATMICFMISQIHLIFQTFLRNALASLVPGSTGRQCATDAVDARSLPALTKALLMGSKWLKQNFEKWWVFHLRICRWDQMLITIDKR